MRATLPGGALALVFCQKAGAKVYTTSVWDRLDDSYYVTDYYLATPKTNHLQPTYTAVLTSSVPRPGYRGATEVGRVRWVAAGDKVGEQRRQHNEDPRAVVVAQIGVVHRRC